MFKLLRHFSLAILLTLCAAATALGLMYRQFAMQILVEVVKVKIDNLRGLTVFSSEARQIGEAKNGNARRLIWRCSARARYRATCWATRAAGSI